MVSVVVSDGGREVGGVVVGEQSVVRVVGVGHGQEGRGGVPHQVRLLTFEAFPTPQETSVVEHIFAGRI